MSDSVWHEGELQVQRRAGVASEAGELQGMVRPGMAPPVVAFLSQRQFAVLGSIDANERVWASVVVGNPGFIRAQDPFTVEIAGGWAAGDPLLENIRSHSSIGMLAIDFNNRRRVRINGTAQRADGTFRIHVQQVFSNCPKYIQARIPAEMSAGAASSSASSATLTESQKEWISGADTLFIASSHPQHGTDASHRGGNPGFIHVESGNRLVIPDYSGNNLFNTLGNIQLNPKAGLLFVNFETGATLQLTGKAGINWDEAARVGFEGGQRLLEFEIEEVRETQHGAPLRFEFRTFSPFNPVL